MKDGFQDSGLGDQMLPLTKDKISDRLLGRLR